MLGNTIIISRVPLEVNTVLPRTHGIINLLFIIIINGSINNFLFIFVGGHLSLLPYQDKEKCGSPFSVSAHSGIVTVLVLMIELKINNFLWFPSCQPSTSFGKITLQKINYKNN